MNLNQSYSEDLYTYINFLPSSTKVNVGIDEAGRGPVLGHLVYGALITHSPVSYPDSKKATAINRETFFEEIQNEHSFIYTAIHPAYISRKMLAQAPEKQNLNKISYNAVINIIREIEKVYDIDTIYVDTLGPEVSYKKMLLSHFPNFKFIVEQKADSKYGIVGGASIVAKVIRDRLLCGWDIKDKNVGSGYPGDEATKKWIERNLEIGKKIPEIVRRSWMTVRKYINKENPKNNFKRMGFKKLKKTEE